MFRVLASAALWGLGLVVSWGSRTPADEPAPACPLPVQTAAKVESNAPDAAAEKVAPTARPTPPCVGTLDLARTFAKHEGFKRRNEEMRVTVAAAETELKIVRDKLQELVDDLALAKQGSVSKKTLGERISLEQALLKARVETQKEAFTRIEANIYKEVYEEIRHAIAAQADARGMRLVLRFSGDSIDAENPTDIVKALNYLILHQDGIDLTDAVIAAVNGEPAADGATPPAPPADESRAAACPVATLDLARVYAEDLAFKQLNDEMKRDVERAEADLKSSRDGLQAESGKLAELAEGSDAYVEKEAAFRKGSAVIESQVALRKQQFAEQEAKNYYGVFRSVGDELRRLAESRGFNLVLRFSDTSTTTSDPKEIVKELNQVILYQREIDVTDDVIAALNTKHAGKE